MRAWQGCALGAIVACALGMSAQAAVAADPVARLHMGETAFWPGTFVASARVDDPGLCGVQGACFSYPLEVLTPHARVLRVGLSSPDDSNGWEVRLLDPSGHEAASGSTYTLDGFAENFDVEVFAHDPAVGTWTVQVIPQNVHDGDFSARAALGDPPAPAAAPTPAPAPASKQASCAGQRAKVHAIARRHHSRRALRAARHALQRCRTRLARLQAAPNGSGGVTDILPDLAPDPPWHVTFRQPPPMVIVEGSNYPNMAGVHDTDASAGGEPIYQCLPEESAEQGAKRCLRFTTGFASLGPGAFEVYGSSDTPVAVNGGDVYQVIQRSDGTTRSHLAGKFVFHHIHMHYHVLGIAQFSFFRVDADHTLTPAAKALKEGFCLGNIKLYNWKAFDQEEIDPSAGPNCEPQAHPNDSTQLPDGTWRFYEGMAKGWEDAYKWQTSGQYVDFADNPDGTYVLRMTVNPDRHLLEADYDNNSAYTELQITGNDVRPIERGLGTDPWDPHKVVLNPVIGR